MANTSEPISCTVPPVPSPQIKRENLISAVEDALSGQVEMLLVQGQPGIGKTALLSELYRSHSASSVGVFINPLVHVCCDPDYLRLEIEGQLNSLLSTASAKTDEGRAGLASSIYRLQRRIRKLGKPKCWFIVDGIDEVSDPDWGAVSNIIKSLPFGFPDFRFVFSGEPERILGIVNANVTHKDFFVVPFIYHETRQYLSDLDLGEDQVQALHKLTGGIPARVASARRLLHEASDYDECLVNIGSHPDLYSLEWKRAQNVSESIRLALAVLAHDKVSHTLRDLGELVGVAENDLRSGLARLGFVLLPENPEGAVSFISEDFRGFAATKLLPQRERVFSLMIGRLMEEPESETALSELPDYLEAAGRLEDLLEYLSSEHMDMILQVSESLAPISKKAGAGVRAAETLGRDGDLLRFSLQKASIAELDSDAPWESELEARLALGQDDEAMLLANGAILKEDRLHALAVIGRHRSNKGCAVDPAIVAQIEQLCRQVDYEVLGSRAIDLAGDLLYVSAELGLEFLENAMQVTPRNPESDIALAKVTIDAAKISSERPELAAALKGIGSGIVDPNIRRFTSSVGLFVGARSASEVISEVSGVKSVNDSLFLLRQWTQFNAQREDAHLVVDYALDSVIRSDYVPTATDLQEIATPLPHVTDTAVIARLIKRIDSQLAMVRRMGPSEDFVRLLLLVAEAECKLDREAAASRLMDAYFYLHEVDDEVVRLGCLSTLIDGLEASSIGEELEGREHLKEVVREEVVETAEILLSATADQLIIFDRPLKIIAKRSLQMASNIAALMNTRSRRDAACVSILDAYAESAPVGGPDWPQVKQLIKSIHDSDWQLAAQNLVIGNLLRRKGYGWVSRSDYDQLLTLAKEISSPGEKGMALAQVYAAGVAIFRSPEETADVLALIVTTWERIGRAWERVDAGYVIARALAEADPNSAAQFINRVDDYRSTIRLDSPGVAMSYMASVRLAIRAFGGLGHRSQDLAQDRAYVAKLIEEVPSAFDQCALWHELAVRFQLAGRGTDRDSIVDGEIKPLLNSLKVANPAQWRAALINAAPMLHANRVSYLAEVVKELPANYRDQAALAAAEYIRRKTSLEDALNLDDQRLRAITYEDALDMIQLGEWVTGDLPICHLVKSMADSICSHEGAQQWSREKRGDVGRRLRELIDAKLPEPVAGIAHKGYYLVTLALVNRIELSGYPAWEAVVKEVRLIPNAADRALVASIVAAAMAFRFPQQAKDLLRETEISIPDIPSVIDRISRFQELGADALSTDRDLSKRAYRQAMAQAVSADDDDGYSAQRRVLDAAYQIDPEFARSLASVVDDDPGRERTRHNLKERLGALETRDVVLQAVRSGDKSGSDETEVVDAARLILRELISNRIETFHVRDIRNYLARAAGIPFHRSYPLFAWFVENAVRRHRDTDQAGTILRPMFEALVVGSETIIGMTGRSTAGVRIPASQYHPDADSGANILITEDAAESAVERVAAWITRHANGFVLVADPYFGPTELIIFRDLIEANADVPITVITSLKSLRAPGFSEYGPAEAFRKVWQNEMTGYAPQKFTVVVVRVESDPQEFPIHDRWILTEGIGLDLGTSVNGISSGKLTSIKEMEGDELGDVRIELTKYANQLKLQYKGKRLIYDSFTL